MKKIRASLGLLALLGLAIAVPVVAEGTWVHCSDKWAPCYVPFPAKVRYGAEGQYRYQFVDHKVFCNRHVFGMAYANETRSCEYLLADNVDSDGDGVMDNVDLYPSDPLESADTDGDGIGDNSDPFPNDRDNAKNQQWVYCASKWAPCYLPFPALVRYGAEDQYRYQFVDHKVFCNRHVFAMAYANKTRSCEYLIDSTDSDGDGVVDSQDAFPNDPTESQDNNGDGVGDNQVKRQVTRYTYNTAGKILTVDGPRTDVDDITTYTYDDDNRRTHATNALGHTTQWRDYNERGQPQTLIDANGVTTQLTYHTRGWLLSRTVVDPTGDSTKNSTTHYRYDKTGRVVGITLPNQVDTTYTYDTAGRLTGISNALGERIDYTLDNAGNRIAETITNGNREVTYRLTRAYDELSRLMEEVGAEGQTHHRDYDQNGNATTLKNPRDLTTQQAYDALDRLTQTTDPLNGTTYQTYDDQNRLTQITDANGNATRYTYNAFDQVVRLDSPDTGISRYTYDPSGNRTLKVDNRGVVSRYRYDALNRLMAVDFPSAPAEAVRYHYDQGDYGKGRLTQISDPSGTTDYRYDHRGNLIRKTVNLTGVEAPLTTQYRYDSANNPLEIIYPGGIALHYRYNTLGRLKDIEIQRPNQAPQSLLRDLVYQPFGGLTTLTYGNDLQAQWGYNQDYRLTQYQVSGEDGTLINQGYTYDANGNITQIDRQAEQTSQTLGYDALDRLQSSQGIAGERRYRYDPVGNRLERHTPEGLYSYDYLVGSNILAGMSHEPQSQQAITVDANGNTTHLQTVRGHLIMRYNAANRVEQVTLANGETVEYRYNALGQRTHKRQASGHRYYLYHENGQLQGEYDETGAMVQTYVWLGHQPIAQITDTAISYYHNDHLGTPIMLTNNRQQIVWKARYTPFGEATISIEGVENRLRFVGQYFDPETGLHYNWNRYYNPETGRYITSDPIGLDDGPNTYAYVKNNPLTYYDPNGLSRLLGQSLGGTLGEALAGGGAASGYGGGNSSSGFVDDPTDIFGGASPIPSPLIPHSSNNPLDGWDTPGLPPRPTETNETIEQCPPGGSPEFDPEERCVVAAARDFAICSALSTNPFSAASCRVSYIGRVLMCRWGGGGGGSSGTPLPPGYWGM